MGEAAGREDVEAGCGCPAGRCHGQAYSAQDCRMEQRRALYDTILARLEAKSEHGYQWPRWAAAEEAAEAVLASPWLAAYVAAAVESAKAEGVETALREAADEYLNGGLVPKSEHRHWVSGWLRDRAAALATEATP